MTVALLDEALDQPTKRFCGAKKRQGEGWCHRPSGWGTDHAGHGRCKLHGGGSPAQKVHVAAQIAEQRARTMFGKTYDDRPVTNPLEVFAELAGTVRGWLKTMEALTSDLARPGYRSEVSGEQIRAEVQLFERAMDRANTVLSTYARLGIDERLARISEAQALMVMGAIEAALAAVGVTGARAIEAKKAAAKRLRVVDGEATTTTP